MDISARNTTVPENMDAGDDTLVARLLALAAAGPTQRYVHLTYRGVETDISYGDLLAASLVYAGLYRAQGVRPRDVVLLFVPTDPRMYAAFFGAMLAGGIASFMPCPSGKQDPDRYWKSHNELLARIEPRCVLTTGALAEQMRAAGLDLGAAALCTLDNTTAPLTMAEVVHPTLTDVAFLQHSSGTTGLKKGVMLTHAAVATHARCLGAALGATADDVVATWLPVYHDMGLISSTILPLMLGQQIIAMDPFEWSADPLSMLRVIERHRATLAWVPNFAFEHMVNASEEGDTFDLGSMRGFIDCSEPCIAATMTRFQLRFASSGVTPQMMQCAYGMAENVFIATQTQTDRQVTRMIVADDALRSERRARRPRDGERAVTVVSVGPAIPGTIVEIGDETGALLPDGMVGELLISGSSLFDGYFRQPDLTAEKLVDGRFHSRDEGFVWQGEVFVLGRLDDRIIVHGRNFYAGEIESIVARVEGMKPGRAVALGVENDHSGSQELVVVVESTLEGDAQAALRRTVKAAVFQAMALSPHEVRLVPPGWLSKTTSGKINRGLNKTRYLDIARNGPSTVAAPSLIRPIAYRSE